jgi:hypothetical protein
VVQRPCTAHSPVPSAPWPPWSGIGIVAHQEIDPGDTLLPLGQRLGRQALGRLEQGLGRGAVIGLDEGLHPHRQLGGDLVAPDALGADAAGAPSCQIRLCASGSGEGPSRRAPGEPGELFGLGQFGRFVEERDQPLGIDPGRSLGGIEFGAGDGVEGPRLQRVELQLRIGPAALADRGEDARITRLLIGIEQRGDGGRGLWRAVARASAAGSSGRRRRRCRFGRQQSPDGRRPCDRLAQLHARMSPMILCKSFQLSAFAIGFSIRKRGWKLATAWLSAFMVNGMRCPRALVSSVPSTARLAALPSRSSERGRTSPI